MAIETPLPVQAEIIAKHLGGASKSQIARDLQMSRTTIVKVLNEAEISRLTGEAKSILLNALPDSARTIARAVRKKSSDAWELLDRTGVMPKSTGDAPSVNVAVALGSLPAAFHGNSEDRSAQ